MQKILNLVKYHIFYLLHPKAAICYSAILNLIKQKNLDNGLILEAQQICRKALIIKVLLGKKYYQHNLDLIEYCNQRRLSFSVLLSNRQKSGIPDIAEVIHFKYQPKTIIKIIGRYFNLHFRELLIRFYISSPGLSDRYYKKDLLLPLTTFSRLNCTPCHQAVILIRFI